MMRVSEAVDEYRYAILQLSDETQVWYMKRLTRFSQWCTQQGLAIDQVRPTSIAKYLHELATLDSQSTHKKLSSYTIHGHARTIRTFLFWAAKEPQSYLLRSTPDNIVMPRILRKIIETFDQLHIKALFAATEQEHSRILVARDKAILAILLDTGIRASELCGLLLTDIHITPAEGHIRVCGKGEKEREIGLGSKSRKLLQSYIKRYRLALPAEQHIFLSVKSVQLTVNGLDQMLYRLKRHAKITGVRVSAHTFRHTFACNFLLQGGDVYVLSRLLGHESVLITTSVYLPSIKAYQARKYSKSVFDNF